MKQVVLLAMALVWGIAVQAQVDPVSKDGVAIGGYDVVSYFSGEAKQGNKTYAAKHDGVTYYFANKANKAKFVQSPNMFLPQFDGYCAWGIGEKQAKFSINPETFDVVDGKLYLFFNGDFNGEPFNTLPDWTARTTELTKAAHKSWPKVMAGK